MRDCISLKDALKIIDTKNAKGEPIPFDIEFRTLNRNSKAGGTLRSYRSVTILTAVHKQRNNKQVIKDLQKESGIRRNPNHWQNRTRNLQKANGDIFKVNIRLITSINNQKVVY